VKEALDQLTPVFLVRSFVNPVSQGAISVNLDCGYVPEKEAEVLNHEVFPVVCGRPARRLWSQHAVMMLQEGRSGGPRIIFPIKSICRAAIMLRTQGME
jgi:hypothetical protein